MRRAARHRAKLITTAEAALIVQKSRLTIWKAVKDGKLTRANIGGRGQTMLLYLPDVVALAKERRWTLMRIGNEQARPQPPQPVARRRPSCPRCRAMLWRDEDGDPACFGCGWRPTRAPSADDVRDVEIVDGQQRRRRPRAGGVTL